MELITEIQADEKSHVTALKFSEDGKKLFSSGFDTNIKIWAVSAKGDFKLAKTLAGHANCANAFAFRGGGKILVSVSSDGTLREGKLPSGNAAGSLSAHGKPVFAVRAFSLRGEETLATSSYDGTIRFWEPPKTANADKYMELGRVKGKGREIGALRFRNQGKELITAGWGPDISIWSVPDGKELERIPHGSKGIASMPEIAANKYLCMGYEGRASVLDAKTGKLTEAFRVEGKGYFGTCIAPNKKRAAICVDHGVVLFDLKKGVEIARAKVKPRSTSSPTFTPDGKLLLIACADKKFRVFRV